MQYQVTLAGLIVGVVVGLTGMGGGALMTPILVIFFNIQPLAAVSSDLVASLFMKPVGAAVHIRRGTVNWDLVKWLVIGSVPFAFSGVFVINWLGGDDVQGAVKTALGYTLLLAAAGLVWRTYLNMRDHARKLAGDVIPTSAPVVRVRPVPTLLVGAVGGLVVGMTSVGSGSLIIIALLMLYPILRANQLVGTDLVQAVPLVAAAALGHLLYGDFQLGLTVSLLLGAIPGVYIGARLSAQAPGGIVRRALAVVLVASGLKLVGVPTVTLFWVLVVAFAGGSVLWMLIRRQYGLPALAHSEPRRPARPALADRVPADPVPADTVPADTVEERATAAEKAPPVAAPEDR